MNAPTGHTSVLLHEAIDVLNITPKDTVVDATVGGAGHFGVLLQKLGSEGTLIGIDADSEAISRAQSVYDAAEESPRVFFVEDNFRNMKEILDARDVVGIDKALFDLGWSSYQLSRGRGFSFQADEPLLMTYSDPASGVSETAADFLRTASEETMADVFYSLGEEQFSRRIAKAIVEARSVAPIETTFQLVEVIKSGTPSWYHHRRLHPATKTFQALRMHVNDELGALRDGLGGALSAVRPGGRISVITFHSIEDRIVKHMFREEVLKGRGSLVSKKPILPSPAELSANPRARSAKLRIFERCSKISKDFSHTCQITNETTHSQMYV